MTAFRMWRISGIIACAISLMESVCPLQAQDQKASWTLRITSDRPDGVYRKGEEAVFRISLLDEAGRPVVGKEIKLSVARELDVAQKVVTSGESPVEVRAKLENPGFILCTATCESEPGKNAMGFCGVGFDPLEIRQSRPAPDDFDSFWNKQKQELSKVPMNPRLQPLDPLPELGGKVEAFDVKLDCLGGAPVSGYFARPAGAAPKSLPAFLNLQGAGVRSAFRMDQRAAQGMLAMDINAHGIENGKPDSFYKELETGRLNGYQFFGSDSREKSYFLGMFLRVVRALEFLKSQPEWDGRTLIAFGCSQGGAQAIVAAGLDPQVNLCVALVPAMCEHSGFLVGRTSGWPGLVRLKDGKPENPDVAKASAYFDAASFAARMKAKAFFNVGFIDLACSPSSVYAAYNSIKTAKEIEVCPGMGHVYKADEADKRVADFIAAKPSK